jgi:hypothetical protein
MYPNIYIYMCVCARVLHAYTCIIQFICICENRPGHVCVYECAMVMDWLCAHTLAGSCCGLGLKP